MTMVFSTSYAKNLCKNSPYKMVDAGVPFGTKTKAIKKLAKKAFKKASYSLQDHKNVVFVTFDSPFKNLDKIAYFSIEGKVTRVLFGYHKSMINKFGGLAETLKAMLEKLIKSYGKPDDMKTDNKSKVTVIYNSEKGMTLSLIGDESDGTIMLRYDCDALESAIRAEQTKNTNFGF